MKIQCMNVLAEFWLGHSFLTYLLKMNISQLQCCLECVIIQTSMIGIMGVCTKQGNRVFDVVHSGEEER